MSLKRIGAIVALGLFLLSTASPVFSQGLRGMQLFDTPDTSTVGRGQRPNEGFFFSYDGLYWNVSPPDNALIGAEGSRIVSYGIHPTGAPGDTQNDTMTQVSSLDTSQLSGWQTANWVGGQRIEGGRMRDGRGWLLSFTELQNQTMSFLSQNATMVIDDPYVDQAGHNSLQGIVGVSPTDPTVNIVRNLPITFSNVNVINNTAYWSIEWMLVGRSQEIGEGHYLEWFAGPRYAEFNDTFLVNANGGILNATNWATDAQNHIVAGQLGARYFKKVGRWMLNTEGRFFAGLNYQNIHQFGVLGSNLSPPGGLMQPLTLGPVAFSHADFEREFTPGIELRLELRYQLTRAISFKAGWSGTWMDSIARASSLVDYTLPNFGIDPSHNRQQVFMNGVVIGIDINR
jgi:hypothetical protein